MTRDMGCMYSKQKKRFTLITHVKIIIEAETTWGCTNFYYTKIILRPRRVGFNYAPGCLETVITNLPFCFRHFTSSIFRNIIIVYNDSKYYCCCRFFLLTNAEVFVTLA